MFVVVLNAAVVGLALGLIDLCTERRMVFIEFQKVSVKYNSD
jgi:hypothetical protein